MQQVVSNWYLHGELLCARDLQRLDAAEFIERDEWDCAWRLCEVPLQLLPALSFKDCKFKVSEAGRQRVLREKRKNVHAGVAGIWLQRLPPSVRCAHTLTYNPYQGPYFVECKTRQAVFQAHIAELKGRHVFITR